MHNVRERDMTLPNSGEDHEFLSFTPKGHRAAHVPRPASSENREALMMIKDLTEVVPT